jgi:hypothetical protein
VTAKTLMLTTPVLVMLAWAGVAALRASPLRHSAPLLALALAGGVIASDALQYHGSNLAPTARYEELASIGHRFAGRGPALFTDFDEYALYQLRNLDVGGPNFEYSPPALKTAQAGYRYPVQFDRLAPAALRSYPLIVTRRDPAAERPPSAYRPLWQGVYYEVWARRDGAPAAIADVGLSGSVAAQCASIARLAALARGHRARLVATASPQLVRIPLLQASRPARWARLHHGLEMRAAGRLSAEFVVPAAGVWDVWLEGQIMPAVSVSVDGRRLASVKAQLGGNSVVTNTVTPVPVSLSAGRHRLSVARGGLSLAPGDGGSADLYGIFLAPAHVRLAQPLPALAPARWRSLCGRPYEWIELVPS